MKILFQFISLVCLLWVLVGGVDLMIITYKQGAPSGEVDLWFCTLLIAIPAITGISSSLLAISIKKEDD